MPIKKKFKFKKSYPRIRTRIEKVTQFLYYKSWKTQISFKKILFNMWELVEIELPKVRIENLSIKVL